MGSAASGMPGSIRVRASRSSTERPARCASRRICRVRFSRCAGLGLGARQGRPPGVFGYIARMTGRGEISPIAGDLRLAAEAGQGRAA